MRVRLNTSRELPMPARSCFQNAKNVSSGASSTFHHDQGSCSLLQLIESLIFTPWAYEKTFFLHS